MKSNPIISLFQIMKIRLLDFHCLGLLFSPLFYDSRLKVTKLQHVFLWLSLQSHYRVTDEAFLAETSKYGPPTSLRMCLLLLKERTSCILIFPKVVYLSELTATTLTFRDRTAEVTNCADAE